MKQLVARSGGNAKARLIRRGRTPGVRTFKTTFAVVASFLVAEWLHLSEHPVVAPLTALLVVQMTLYRTIYHGLGRVGGVLAGVVVAVVLANFAGYTWWSLAIVIAGSMVTGRLMGLGALVYEVPISAMLVLEVGGGHLLGLARVEEALIGAAVGIAVNLLIAPPLYLQPAGEAIGELADRMAHFCRQFAEGLDGPWSRAAADTWMNQARSMNAEVHRAEVTVARAEESGRFNPRGKEARDAQPRLRTTLTGLERCHLTLRTVARAVLDRTYSLPLMQQAEAYTPEQRAAIADVLTTTAAALEAIVPLAEGKGNAEDARAEVESRLVAFDYHRERLSSLLAADNADPKAWTQHGSLLASIGRLAVEIQAAAKEPAAEWRPEQVSPRGEGRRAVLEEE